jgi:hypothetical protein
MTESEVKLSTVPVTVVASPVVEQIKVVDELTAVNGWRLHDHGWIGPLPETDQQRLDIKALVERFWGEVQAGNGAEYPGNSISFYYLTEYVFIDDDANDGNENQQ